MSERYCLSEDVVFEVVGTEAVLIDMMDDSVYSLNTSGTFLMLNISGGLNRGELVLSFADRFRLEHARAATDVGHFLDAMINRGILRSV